MNVWMVVIINPDADHEAYISIRDHLVDVYFPSNLFLFILRMLCMSTSQDMLIDRNVFTTTPWQTHQMY